MTFTVYAYMTFLNIYILYEPPTRFLIASAVLVLIPVALAEGLKLVVVLVQAMNIKDLWHLCASKSSAASRIHKFVAEGRERHPETGYAVSSDFAHPTHVTREETTSRDSIPAAPPSQAPTLGHTSAHGSSHATATTAPQGGFFPARLPTGPPVSATPPPETQRHQPVVLGRCASIYPSALPKGGVIWS